MSSGHLPAPPWRGPPATPPAPPGPAWRSPPPRAPYRPRWRRLAFAGALALAALAAVTWVVFWVRPPEPARIVILQASYDRTLAVPPNPYGKADARELAALTQPGSWFGKRSRLNGGPVTPLTRAGLPDLSGVREKCVVVFLAAHGGRDRDGPFLFPEDSDGSPAERVRFTTLLDQLAKLPAKKQKLLVIDATRAPAYADLGLVLNDFAAGVEELDAQIAAVPNLAVLLSSGLDERSWASPEWGTSAFMHFAMVGLNGGADLDGNKRVTAGELAAYLTPRVSDWVRDNRAARQVPVLLPKGDGEARANAMHLVSVEGAPGASAAPVPFEPPPELEAQWKEYRELANATPPPTAYTPHLWRQYEAWTLRHEELILANDADGAKLARASAGEVRRKIEAARTLDISPQTLTLQAAVGGQPYVAAVPARIKQGMEALGTASAANRAKVWTDERAATGDTEPTRLLWCRALIEWVAVDPVPRLPISRDLIPIITDGLPVRPAEVNFLAALAKHLPPPDKKDVIGPLLTKVLRSRLRTEEAAAAIGRDWVNSHPEVIDEHHQWDYPFAEFVYLLLKAEFARADELRRGVEDRAFSTSAAAWTQAYDAVGDRDLSGAVGQSSADTARRVLVAWQSGAHSVPVESEEAARGLSTNGEVAAFAKQIEWSYLHQMANVPHQPPVGNPALFVELYRTVNAYEEWARRSDMWQQVDELLKVKPEFEANPTPRANSVKWFHQTEAVLTAPGAYVTVEDRVKLVREFRRVSRQLLVTNETRPEALPEVTPAKAREVAFEAAKRRGLLLIARFGGFDSVRELARIKPGEDAGDLNLRLESFALRADGRASLAAFGSRCGELFDAAAELARKPDAYLAADRWVRISPAHAKVSDAPTDRTRRERVRGYLAWQAQRTYSDHWYTENGLRYFNIAIQRLATDAAGVVAAFAPTDDPFAPFLGPELPFPIAPKLPARVVITDEPNPQFAFGFSPRAVPGVSGYATFWTDPKQREAVSTAPGDTALARVLTRPAPPVPLTPKAQTQALAVSGFFRGRTLDAATALDFYPAPDRAALTAPPPQSVSIAVRADLNARKRYGFASGAVAIVLDCSGSMGRDPKDPKSVGLYPEAVAALDALLKGLPPGTTVTVWTFGQKTPGAKSPEDTIRELLAPTTLTADSDALVADVVAKARAMEPWHESPVTRAAVSAKNRIRDAKVPFRAVVLISDAVDNRFAVDPEYGEKKRTIGDVLRAEFPPEVAFGVVAFPVGKEEQAVQGEFQIVEKLMPAGKFVPPEKVDELIAWLRTGLNPRVRFSLEPIGSDAQPLGGLMAGSADSDNWYVGKLAPGRYRLRVAGDTSLASNIALSPGDRLLLDLIEDRGRLTLQRHWYADRVQAVEKAGGPTDPWRMALLQNRAKGGAAELFAVIDGNPALVNALEPTRIGDVWFDVTPTVPAPEPVAVRWRAEGGFPAPAWALASPGWPRFPGTDAPAAPRLSAWWSPEPFAAAPEQLKARGGGTILGYRDHTMTVAGDRVEVTTALEEHEFDGAKRLCLAVRVAHADGAPLLARLVDFAPAREARAFKAANRTTTLFWWPGLDEASVKTKVSAVEFVPLADALKTAEKAGRHLTLTAPVPTDTSARPEPPTK